MLDDGGLIEFYTNEICNFYMEMHLNFKRVRLRVNKN